MYADDLTIDVAQKGNLTVSGKVGGTDISDGKVEGTITIGSTELANVLDGNMDSVRVNQNTITLGNLAKNVQQITYDTANNRTKIVGDARIGDIVIEGKTLYVAGTAGPNSTITIDDMLNTRYATKGVKHFVTVGEGASEGTTIENGVLKIHQNGTVEAAKGKFRIEKTGAITAADNKFIVDEKGELQVENKLTISQDNGDGTGRSAYLDIDGLTKLNQLVNPNSSTPISLGQIEAADESKIGGITISGGQLSASYSGAPEGIARVNVSDLYDDHKLVNDTEVYGNKKLNSRINSLETSDDTLTKKTGGIERVLDNSGNPIGTVIEKKLYVYEDGTVLINEGKEAQVTIGSNRLSIGNVSLIENDYVEANGTIHYNQTINDYAKLNVKKGKIGYKVGNYSVTTSAATATGNYDVDQANKGTVFSNDTNYTRIDGAEINSVNGKNTGVLDGSWLELTYENGSKAVLRQGGLILTDTNGYETKLEDGRLSYGPSNDTSDVASSITISELVGIQANTQGISRDVTGTTIEGILKVGTDGTLSTENGNFTVGADGNIASNGTLSVAGGKFFVDANGVVTAGSVKMGTIEEASSGEGVTVGGVVLKDKTISAADNKFQVDADGKLTSASGSVIRDVTIEGDTLSTSQGAVSVTVTDLAKDHNLLNDSDKGNVNLYNQIGLVQGNVQALTDKTQGIARDTTSAVTTIEGKLKVGRDGTVKINEGEDQQVIIDSNGIKVGKNSSRMNDSYGFATTKDLYIGADSADAPTAAGSKFYVKGEDGSFKAAGGKFTVDADGALSAAGGKFTVDKDGTLTTKKLITNELVITGSGAAGGITNGGSIAFGGNGTIKSNIVDGAKKTDFETKADGVSTNVEDGTKTTKTEVKASGSTSTVTDGTLKSERNQTASAITDTVGDNSVTTNADGTTFNNGTNTTNINGSQLTSTNGTSKGTLDGSQLTLTDGTDKTELTAGGATFTKGGKTTTIDGEGITVTDASGVRKDINFENLSKLDTTSQANTAAIENLKQSKANVDGSNIDVSAWSEKLGNGATGAIEKDNKGLVNGGTVYDALEKKADTDYVDNMASGLNSRMEAMSYSLTRDMNRVGAGAAALAGLHPQSYDPDCKLDFAAGYGHYRNANAMAIGMYYRPNAGTMFSLAGTIGNGDPMVSAGVSFKIGYNSKVEKVIVKKEDYDALQEQVNQLTQVVQQLIADKEAAGK